MNKSKWVIKWIVAGFVFALLLGAVTMLLWNWLVPSLFNGPEIRFAQAFGLLVLARILFGGWGGRKCHDGRGDPSWKHRYQEKLSTMSPEDRERFKSRMWEKWCSTGPGKKDNSGNSND